MEDNIVLDNYHGKGEHIHPDPKQHKEEIKIKHDTQKENLNILISHINKIQRIKIK